MLRIDPSRQVGRFLKRLLKGNPKHARQIALKIQALRHDPEPPDSKAMKGDAKDYRRADAGEYRIVYRVEGDVLKLAIVAKRNDANVYRKLRRKR